MRGQEMIFRFIVAIILALALIVFIARGGLYRVLPDLQKTTDAAREIAQNNLVTGCKQWALKSEIGILLPTVLATGVTEEADLDGDGTRESIGWDYCADYSKQTGDSKCRCRASCVKLLNSESQCRIDPSRFSTYTWDQSTADRKEATNQCIFRQISAIKEEVAAAGWAAANC